MDKLLVAAGIAIIIFILWKEWAKEATLQKEKEDGRLLLNELADARREVQILLDQLETASEKIVDEISYGLEEIKIQVSSAIEKPDDEAAAGNNKDEKTIKKSKVLKRTRSENSSKKEKSKQTSAQKAQSAVVKEVPPKHQMVYAMADMGHTEDDIAKQMKIGKGEVSLLLQLRRKGEEGDV